MVLVVTAPPPAARDLRRLAERWSVSSYKEKCGKVSLRGCGEGVLEDILKIIT